MRLAILLALILTACGAPADEPQPPAQDTLRIVAYNIHHGEGMDLVLDLERIAKLIKDLNPDLVALQEIDSVVTRTGGVNQAAVLGNLTEMESVFGEFMPYQGGKYGMAVMSRWPILSSTNHRLPDGNEPRSALSIRIQSPETGRELEFVGIHFYMTEAERLAQAQALTAAYANTARPVIIAGDFNSEPDSPVLAHLAENWAFVEKGEDNLTFSSFEPVKEIDFFALRPGADFEIINQYLIDEPVMSDHRPLYLEVVW